jgi:Heparinase II/III-like protein/Heparinase II/III N-terminus
MTRILGRLSRTGADEVWFRCVEGTRVAGEALRFVCRRERWNRARLLSRLRPSSADLVQARAALARHDWSGANAALRSHFSRRAPRFVIHPAARPDICATAHRLFPSATEDAVRRADQLLVGRYDLLGYRGLSFRSHGLVVDWHRDPVHGRRAALRFWARVPYLDPRLGDHKIIWELNRHQHWMALGRAAWLSGDRRYLAAIGDELESWMLANPPLAGINWSSMLELALRSISWIWTLHFLASLEEDGTSTSLLDLLLGVERQLDHVARHLSFYFSPNTHLLGEALALYVAGRVLPELRPALRWEQIGRDVLINEARVQVHSDGGHAERSTHYHRYTLDFYLLALAVARRTEDPAAEPFAAVASRLASFCRALADDDGSLPTIGDDDGGLLLPLCGRAPTDASDSLWLAAALLGQPELVVGDPPEEALWLLGPDAIRNPPARRQLQLASQLYPDTGYVVLRGRDGHAIFDAGPHGFLNGGHAHAGALSLVLSVRGRPLLIDPGTATYTTDRDVRDRFRSTAMHNTVVVDDRSQSVPAGPFHWESRANAHVALWRPGLRPLWGTDTRSRAEAAPVEAHYVEGLHNGYLPQVHRRAVLSAPHGLYIIADHILGTGRHAIDAYWHLAPTWVTVAARGLGTHVAHPDGLWASIASTGRSQREFHGDAEGFGWCAPVYGRLVPALTVRFSDAGDAPVSLITAIIASPSSVQLSVEATPVLIDCDDGWHRAAATVMVGHTRMVALFAALRSGEERSVERRSMQRMALWSGEFATDARMALLSISPAGEPISLTLVDGSEATWTHRGGTTIALVAGSDMGRFARWRGNHVGYPVAPLQEA